MDMSSPTMAGMSMPSSTSASEMPMSPSNMNMVFFLATNTPLYSAMWSPTSTGGYAGTCIFLITLAVLYRALGAVVYIMEKRFADRERNRRYVVVNGGRPSVAESVERDPEAKKMSLVSERGVEESVRVVTRQTRGVMPWRLSVDGPRAGLRTIMAGVGYLLMLAVMTMNVGYFLSVLAGTLVGELALGRYMHSDEH